MKHARDIACCVGVAGALAGVACYDWRVALILGGLAIAGGALWGMSKDDR